MATDAEITAKFWAALKSDMTMFLGLAEGEDGHARPMTAQIEGDDGGPIWFFASSDSALVGHIGDGGSSGSAIGGMGGASKRAMAHFVSKGHDVWATVHGSLSVTTDRATIDRLWNPHVAAWYEHGQDDPTIRLIRLDTEAAEIWLDGSSLVAGVKALFGVDPKQDYQDKVAKVAL